MSSSQQPTVLFSIYQNNTWTIRCMVDETIDPAYHIEDCRILIMLETSWALCSVYHSLLFVSCNSGVNIPIMNMKLQNNWHFIPMAGRMDIFKTHDLAISGHQSSNTGLWTIISVALLHQNALMEEVMKGTIHIIRKQIFFFYFCVLPPIFFLKNCQV